jgi:predicted methyltransferase
MTRRIAVPLLLAVPLALVAAAPASGHQAATADAPLAAALAAPTRSPANMGRDKYRNPGQTLAFFGVQPNHNVVELWPGGGWYTEILAPYLNAIGSLSVVPPAGQYDERIRAKVAGDAAYGKVTVATFKAGQATAIAAGSADVVLTFRNVHSWLGGDDPIAGQVFAEAFRMLKPGGVFGVVEHRLPESASDERQKSSGYVKVSTVKQLAEQAGFKLAAASEINANPKDTADWPDGVWTLPPAFRLGDKDRAKYLAIGESDRMTLKFVKPQ